jgi:hypothetical protein
MFKQKILAIVKYIVSIGMILLILSKIDINDVIDAIKEAKIFMIGNGLLVMAFSMLIRSYKWRLLLKVQGVDVPLITIINFNYMSAFFNNMFLGSIGGDAFRVYRIIDYSKSRSGAASSVIMDRITGFCMAILLVLVFGIGFILTYHSIVSIRILLYLMISISIIIISMFLLFLLCIYMNNISVLNKISIVSENLKKLVISLWMYRYNSKVIIISMFLSLLYYVTQSIKVYYFALATNIEISIIPFFFITPLVGILRMMPISINGIGIQEGSFVFYLEKIGIAGPSALLVAIMTRVSVLIFSLIGGVLFLIHNGEHRRKQT